MAGKYGHITDESDRILQLLLLNGVKIELELDPEGESSVRPLSELIVQLGDDFAIDCSRLPGRLWFRTLAPAAENQPSQNHSGSIAGRPDIDQSDTSLTASKSDLSSSSPPAVTRQTSIRWADKDSAVEVSSSLRDRDPPDGPKASNGSSKPYNSISDGETDDATPDEQAGQARRRSSVEILRRLRGVVSMKDFAKFTDEMEEVGGKTPLHECCAAPTIDYDKFEGLLHDSPTMVTHCNDRNETPLHVLGKNSAVLNSLEGQVTARKCAILLIEIYPDALTHVDDDGRVPFAFLIHKWVEWTFNQELANAKRNKKERRTFDFGSRSDSGVGSSTASDWMSVSCNLFPPSQIFDEVEFCFEMLSLAMEHLGGMPFDKSKQVRPRLAYRKQREDRHKLAKNVAEIPMFIKTILLLESKPTVHRITNSPLFRRVLLCKECIGPWLTSMVRYQKGKSSGLSVHFLREISRLSLEDYVGSYRKAAPQDEQLFKEAKLEVFETLEELGDVVPSLVVAGMERIDEAVATPAVWFLMNRQIPSPFSVATWTSDLISYFITTLLFRSACLNGMPFTLFPFMSLSKVMFFIVLHCVARRIGEAVSLARISKTVARDLLLGPWKLIDTAGVVFASVAVVHTERSDGANEAKRPGLYAAACFFLWLRMLGFVRVVNEPLATFTMALIQICWDIRYFFFVLLVLVMAFGDMFLILFTNDENLDCDTEDIPNANFCSNSPQPYLQVYAIILGDFEFADFEQGYLVVFLWFCLTFLGSIILLNVLIAVVTFSYESAKDSSLILFRRSRFEFVATHSAMERFLFTGSEKLPDVENSNQPPSLSKRTLYLLTRWLMFLTYLAMTVSNLTYVVEGMYISILMGMNIFAAMMAVLAFLLCALVFVFSALITIAFVGDCSFIHCRGSAGSRDRIRLSMRTRIGLIFGIDINETEDKEAPLADDETPSEHDLLLARFDQIDALLTKIAEKELPSHPIEKK